jgi:hypothetical protein
LYPAELEAWKRDAVAGLGEPRATSAVEARQDRRRVKELERELHRKDKALAETAALLVLAKNNGGKVCWQDFRSRSARYAAGSCRKRRRMTPEYRRLSRR